MKNLIIITGLLFSCLANAESELCKTIKDNISQASNDVDKASVAKKKAEKAYKKVRADLKMAEAAYHKASKTPIPGIYTAGIHQGILYFSHNTPLEKVYAVLSQIHYIASQASNTLSRAYVNEHKAVMIRNKFRTDLKKYCK